jgi:hypothetical protein
MAREASTAQGWSGPNTQRTSLFLFSVAAALALAATLIVVASEPSSVLGSVTMREAKSKVISEFGQPCRTGAAAPVVQSSPPYLDLSWAIWRDDGGFDEVVFASGWTSGAVVHLFPRPATVAKFVARPVLVDLCTVRAHLDPLSITVWGWPIQVVSASNGLTYCFATDHYVRCRDDAFTAALSAPLRVAPPFPYES